jgi:hypothetical protein
VWNGKHAQSAGLLPCTTSLWTGTHEIGGAVIAPVVDDQHVEGVQRTARPVEPREQLVQGGSKARTLVVRGQDEGDRHRGKSTDRNGCGA